MRRSHPFFLIAVLAAGLCAAGFRNIPYLSADEVMQKVKDTQAADAEIDYIRMTTVSSSGEAVTREFISVVQKDTKGDSFYLMRFLAPDDEKGTSLLVTEKEGAEAEQYLYLPALGKPKKIEGSGRAGNFMGSDFTFEDLRKEKVGEWKYDRLEDESVEGTDCYVIMATPADKSREKITGYTYRFLYVDKANFVIRRIELLDSKHVITKVFDAQDYQPANNGTQRPRSGVMTNKVKNTHTIMTLLNTRLNQPVDEKFFTLDTIQHWGPDQEKLVTDLKPAPAKSP